MGLYCNWFEARRVIALRAIGWLCLSATLLAGTAYAETPFVIQVVDRQTGRGVPLVELKTTAGATWYTDSQGLVAFDEAGWMNRRVFFHVHSDGYELKPDGFGFPGRTLNTKPGEAARIELERTMIAQRIYRSTGAGIYRDSVRAGWQAPIKEPLLNGGVVGSDSVVNAVYRDRIYWFWGDTNRTGRPLGNFHVPGATSRLPANGGLDPNVGVDLEYFIDNETGFAKETCRMAGAGPTWITALAVLPDARGRQRLAAAYVKVKPPLSVYRRGIAVWNDEQQRFEHHADLAENAAVYPSGHPVGAEEGSEHLYFAQPLPLVRVAASLADFSHCNAYESYTCLKEGTVMLPGAKPESLAEVEIERDANGRVVYGWKKNTSPVWQREQKLLMEAGKLKPREVLLRLRDRDTGKEVLAHGGSVHWNPYRRRWVQIFVQTWGQSMLGEVWFAEADALTGPWAYAVKIATHADYSFYNPKQHPMFNQEEGRVVFFEGTYSHTFSGNPRPTPWYDYNQLMYRLELDDPRLALPVAIYRGASGIKTGPASHREYDWSWDAIAFFAYDREVTGSVALAGSNCFVLAADADETLFTVPLWQYRDDRGRPQYAVEGEETPESWQRTGDRPVGRVWPKN